MQQTDQLREIIRGRKAADTGDGRAVREAAGLHLREVAQAVGVAHSTLSRWETGEHRPRGEAARRYAAVLAELRAEVAR